MTDQLRAGSAPWRRVATASALACLLLAGCRAQTVRSGAVLSLDGSTLRVASEAASCGCLNLENLTDEEIRVRANYGALTTGEAKLFAREKLRVKFDWCGSAIEDHYVLRAFGTDGKQIRFSKAVEVTSVEPWGRCEELNCDYGALLMKLTEGGTR